MAVALEGSCVLGCVLGGSPPHADWVAVLTRSAGCAVLPVTAEEQWPACTVLCSAAVATTTQPLGVKICGLHHCFNAFKMLALG